MLFRRTPLPPAKMALAATLLATTLAVSGSALAAPNCQTDPDLCDQRLNNAAASSSANLEYVFETLLKKEWGLRNDEKLLKQERKKAIKAFEHSAVEGLLGNWSGAYVCGQGKTGLTLSLEHRPDQTVQGIFRFFPLSTEHTGVKKGAFAVQMFATKDHIFIEPKEWLEQPEGYVTVAMVGKLMDDGQAFAGEVQLPVCGNFALVKPK